MALRAALMRLLSVDSETIRPCQTADSSSSLLTTWSRFGIRCEQQVEDLRLDMDRLPSRLSSRAGRIEDHNRRREDASANPVTPGSRRG